MEIKERDGYFLAKCNNKKVVLAYRELEKVKDEADVYVNSKKGSDKGYYVYNPGEYEVNEIFCMAMAKKGKKAYLIDICEISVLLIPKLVQLNEKDLEQLGQIDLLIIGNEVGVNSDLVKYIGRIDPQILLLHKDMDKNEFEKVFGSKVDELDKKLSVKSSEFDSEDYKMQLLLIK